MNTTDIENEVVVLDENDVIPEKEEPESEVVIIDDNDGPSSDSKEESEEPDSDSSSEDIPVYDVETQGIPDWALPKVEAEILEFKDGSTIEGRASANQDRDSLWISILDENANFSQVAAIFMDPNKTEKITYHSSLYDTPVYEGFTRMAGINISRDGKFKVRMKKE